MKLYTLTIKPLSGFGTALKGDSIFGQFCWQAAYDSALLDGGLEPWVEKYPQQPFAIFSSAYPTLPGETPKFALKRPDLPLSLLFPGTPGKNKREGALQRKENMNKRWMLVSEHGEIALHSVEFVNSEELITRIIQHDSAHTCGIETNHFARSLIQSHNTINRLTSTTGKGMFAPFAEMNTFYHPDVTLTIFVLLDPEATDIVRICRAFTTMGRWGFGKNASTGCGRFQLVGHHELSLPSPKAACACYTLAPAVPEKGTFKDLFFTPFVRFGKHGDVLVRSRNPFKSPVVMADEGAVFIPKSRNIFEKPYIGRAIGGISKSMPQTIAQGYTGYLPIDMES
ncbi:hypothetical protein [Desulfoferrobacter suflitae]|uniref:hypothetical protein n=1 Tax=Desulfoferrobacter suflitae TaxID=2865782 RepID=UPI0021645F65|nr:hypothetical protein [Desulfoferrobacter suflitae]MCK8603006.1 hypothetical protein [Desulfoferrobacter suflitae]